MDNSILRYFGGMVYKALAAYDESMGKLCEIRLRAGKAVGITTEKGYCFLNANGLALAMKSPSPQQVLTVTAMISAAPLRLCADFPFTAVRGR